MELERAKQRKDCREEHEEGSGFGAPTQHVHTHSETETNSRVVGLRLLFNVHAAGLAACALAAANSLYKPSQLVHGR